MLQHDRIRGMKRTRYQEGTIRFRGGKVYGEWRGEPGKDGKRPHRSVILGDRKDFDRSDRKAKRDAKEMLREHIEAGDREIKPSITVADFVQKVYLPAHEAGWSKSSRNAFASSLKNHILKQLGQVPVDAIQKADIIGRINEMRAAGYAKRTIQVAKWLLHSIFEEAIDNDLIAKTPVRRVTLKGIPDGDETRPLTEQEVQRIYAASDGKERLMWRLMVGCGLRPGEVFALRVNDITDSGLRIDEACEHGEFKPPKNGKTRLQPLAESLRAELEAWAKGKGANDLLFHRDSGKPINEQHMHDYIMLPLREATGIEDLKPRMGRATFATLIRADIKDLQELMGHADPEMTLKHYRKSISPRAQASVEALDRRLNRPALKILDGGQMRKKRA